MKVNIILCNPNSNSFNHTIVNEIKEYLREKKGQDIVHDLYKENFNPVLSQKEIERKTSFEDDILIHIKDLEQADYLILVFPDWWGMMPAMLKGWFDRILKPNVAYDFIGEDFSDKQSIGLLENLKVLVCITSHTDKSSSLNSIKKILKKNIFEYCGISESNFFIIENLRNLSSGDKQKILDTTLIKWLDSTIK